MPRPTRKKNIVPKIEKWNDTILKNIEKIEKNDFQLEKSFCKEFIDLPPYRHIPQNYFSREMSFLRLNPREEEIYICKCKPEDGCGPNCDNRLLFIECQPESCPCCQPLRDGGYKYCSNTSIQTQRWPLLEVFKTPSRGHGLRVLEDVEPGTLLIEYLGEVISPQELTHRMKTYKGTDDFYFASLGGGLMLDAGKMGSIARFANHSCDPNSSLQRWTVMGIPHLVLVSNKQLSKGTEITYNYHFTDDGYKNNPLRNQKCQCGSKFCSGTVGGTGILQEVNEIIDKLDNYLDETSKGTTESIGKYLESIQKYFEYSHELKSKAENLLKLVQQTKEIEEKYTLILDINKSKDFRLYSIQELNDLLAGFSPIFRSDEAKKLRSLIQLSETFKKSIITKEIFVITNEHDKVNMILNPNKKIEWEEFYQMIKSIHSILPIFSPEFMILISNYFHILSFTRKWLKSSIPNTFEMNSFAKESQIFLQVTNYYFQNEIQHLLLLPSISSTSITPSSMLTNINLPDSFNDLWYCSSFVNNNLTLYLDRESILQGDMKSIPIDKRTLPISDILVCYCQCFEEESEQSLLINCIDCKGWYHLNCMNCKHLHVNMIKKMDTFYCNICLWRKMNINSFSFEPISEWKYNPNKTKPTNTKDKVIHTSISENVEIQQILDSNHNNTTSLLSFIQKDDLMNKKSQEKIKSRTIFTPIDLENALLEAQSLPILWPPSVNLIKLQHQKYINWHQRTEDFINQITPMIEQAYQLSISLTCIDQLSNIFTVELASSLHQLLKLYYELYLIHVKDSLTINKLRQLIWCISVLPLVIRLNLCTLSSQSFQMTCSTLSRIKYEDIILSIKGGQYFIKDSITLKTIILSYLISNQSIIDQIIQSLNHCYSCEQAKGLYEYFLKINHYFELPNTYSFAKVKALALYITKEERDKGVCHKTQDGIEVNCICQDNTNTDDMICCDGCDEWFHYHCVNITLANKGSKSPLTKKLEEETPTISDPIEDPSSQDLPNKVLGGKKSKKRKCFEPPLEYYCISCCILQQKDYLYSWD